MSLNPITHPLLIKAGVRNGRLEVGTAPTTGLHLELIR